MYCKKCGASDVSGKFCRYCGAPLEEEATPVVNPEAQPEAPAVETPVAETPAVETPAVEVPKAEPQAAPTYAAPQQTQPQQPYAPQQPYNVQPQYNQQPQYQQPQYQQPRYNAPQAPYGAPYAYGAAPVKKKSAAPAIIAVILVLALLGGLGFFLVRKFGGLGGGGGSVKIMKNSSPENYYQSIEKANIATLTDYTANTGVWTGRGGADATVTLSLTDDGKDLLGGFDADWLDSVSLDLSSGKDETKTFEQGTLNINNTKILSFEALLDSTSEELLLKLPDFSKQYMTMPSNDTVSGILGTSGIDMDTVSKVIDRYGKIAVDRLDKVEKTKETVSLGGYSAEYDVLTVTIDGETVANIARDIAGTARKDRDLEKLIRAIAESEDEDPDEAYEDFLDDLDDAEDGDIDSDLAGTMTVYVDKNGEVCGRRYVPANSGESALYYLTVWDGNSFSSEGDLGSVRFTGEGARSGNKISGTYSLRADDSLVATVDVENFDKKAAKDGKIYGTFTVTPGKDFIDDSGISPILAGFRFRIELSSESGKLDANVSILNDSSAIGTIKVSSKSNKSVKIPSVKDGDKVDADEWADSIDLDEAQEKLMDSLTKAGMPEDFLD